MTGEEHTICCHFMAKDTHGLKVRGWKKILHVNGNSKKSGVAILLLDKIDFKTKSMKKDKDTVTDADTFEGTDIDLEEAKEIALKDAGLKEKDVTFVTAKVDYDDGRKYYDVEFYYNGVEYDYEIDAESGRIVDFDKDFEGRLPVVKEEEETKDEITAEKAKEIALKHAGLKESEVTRLKAERDRDDGIVKYDVEFQQGRMEYDYEIDAETGKILKAEKDYDD